MNNTELTSISDSDLFIDIHQNNSLLNNKTLHEKTQPTTNSVSYMSIVDSTDYLGCINGNCSKIECNCKPNENCNCSSSASTKKKCGTNSGIGAKGAKGAKGVNSANSFITKVIDFLFIFILLLLIIYTVYNKSGDYLIYCLGITLIYIFYKMYIINVV